MYAHTYRCVYIYIYIYIYIFIYTNANIYIYIYIHIYIYIGIHVFTSQVPMGRVCIQAVDPGASKRFNRKFAGAGNHEVIMKSEVL